ncbi:hypothetical protein [Vibrio phage BUCT194]|uniref:Uncharacterized protein n=1 Tax=Vibrio phage BUCT194 TaxID=2859072 RepID=A0AAE9BP36_9CAUD|nr:hypothetical protein PP741_gp043 [Vibrio phage BUCT194]UAW01182.1 hypothetical protein [Vibrio phage BUCT194]
MTLFETYRLDNFCNQIHADIWDRHFIVQSPTEGMLTSRLNDTNDLLVDVEGAMRIKP